ncbi:hypothetical protein [Citrobacter phage IME-JL8]|uniref:Uncharacterized protein n=2 Tax=Sertoctavirus TaxID=2560227 RepID=A0AAE7VPW4_9CAUD|nr:hypothetical protein [Citrobacter phage IME-JL8]QXV76565.1 hypothetical protein bas12_0083 [Escherichia phage BrunoManser]
MGRQCKTCRQHYEAEIEAGSTEEAVAIAKDQSGANPATHKFNILLVKEI